MVDFRDLDEAGQNRSMTKFWYYQVLWSFSSFSGVPGGKDSNPTLSEALLAAQLHIPNPLKKSAEASVEGGSFLKAFNLLEFCCHLLPPTEEYELSRGASTERTEGHLTASEILPVDIDFPLEGAAPE